MIGQISSVTNAHNYFQFISEFILDYVLSWDDSRSCIVKRIDLPLDLSQSLNSPAYLGAKILFYGKLKKHVRAL